MVTYGDTLLRSNLMMNVLVTSCLTIAGTNTTSFAGFRACSCLKNSYRLDRFGPCLPCPSQGNICQGDVLTLSPGYHWSLKGPGFSIKEYEQVVENLEIESDDYDRNNSAYHGKNW
jgi:hypothetical protein